MYNLNCMRTLFFIVAFIATSMQGVFAQGKKDSTLNKDPLKNVLAAYIELKNALAGDDEANVSKSGKALFKAIDDVSTDKLTTTQRNVWTKYYEKLSYDARHIKESTDIEHQREHFVSLSKNMYAVIKAFNTNATSIYYQFCPMANDGKGAYWLSQSSKITNPYLGMKMPGCGSIKDTIKGSK